MEVASWNVGAVIFQACDVYCMFQPLSLLECASASLKLERPMSITWELGQSDDLLETPGSPFQDVSIT